MSPLPPPRAGKLARFGRERPRTGPAPAPRGLPGFHTEALPRREALDAAYYQMEHSDVPLFEPVVVRILFTSSITSLENYLFVNTIYNHVYKITSI